MNFDAFSHGQTHSKIWLCEELERYLKPNSTIWVLGSWYNVIGFLLLARRPYYYQQIVGYDLDSTCKPIADSLNAAWQLHDTKIITNITSNANMLDWTNSPDCVINCSVEHFDNNDWLNHVPKNTLVCIQSTNMTIEYEPWLIKQATTSISDFRSKYHVEQELFLGVKYIKMNTDSTATIKGYDRYMLIGYK